MADIKALAAKYNDYIVERRRYYHARPELTEHEAETTEAVVKDLEAMGLPVERFEGMYGCVATLEGATPGKTVLLRADIDALPVKEATGLPFASRNEGRMHACGHDAHIAMQLGAAKILTEMRGELGGTVKFFFQPAEELALGAKGAVERGLMKGVDAVYGAHVWGLVDAGKINIAHGERMASCDMFTLTVSGEASHGSAPHLGRDAVVAASAVIMALQTIVSRVNNPLNSLVLTVGTFDAGQRFNIVADKAVMDGTVRTFDPKFRMKMEEMIRKTARDVACLLYTSQVHVLVRADGERRAEMSESAPRPPFGGGGELRLEASSAARAALRFLFEAAHRFKPRSRRIVRQEYLRACVPGQRGDRRRPPVIFLARVDVAAVKIAGGLAALADQRGPRDRGVRRAAYVQQEPFPVQSAASICRVP